MYECRWAQLCCGSLNDGYCAYMVCAGVSQYEGWGEATIITTITTTTTTTIITTIITTIPSPSTWAITNPKRHKQFVVFCCFHHSPSSVTSHPPTPQK